jgi:hypothetical protein
MSSDAITLTYNEISLLLFALEGGTAAAVPNTDSCEEACPIIESVEELLCGGTIDAHQQLVRHLNNHLREAMIDCGMFELMATAGPDATQSVPIEDAAKLQLVNERLAQWTCDINLEKTERQLLSGCLSRLPKSSWITMPRAMWWLRKKLK